MSETPTKGLARSSAPLLRRERAFVETVSESREARRRRRHASPAPTKSAVGTNARDRPQNVVRQERGTAINSQLLTTPAQPPQRNRLLDLAIHERPHIRLTRQPAITALLQELLQRNPPRICHDRLTTAH